VCGVWQENVYHLCRQLSEALPSSWGVYAVFISNATKCTPVWHQKHHKDTHTPALWDYHGRCPMSVISSLLRPRGP
jgi:hypothetical protein